MRIGVLLMPTDPWPETAETARRLEALGFDHLWVYDHVNWRRYRERPWFGPMPWLAGVAAATSRIRVGTMVANPNIRHPLTLAKDALTVDHISAGRLTLGIGAGGVGRDATIMGAEPLSPGERVDRLAEFLELFDGLLTGAVRSYRGTYFSVEDAVVLPGCVQEPRVPIAVAAGGTRSLRLAAQYSDAWITWGDTTKADLSPAGTRRAVERQMATLDRHAARLGRAQSDLDRIFLIGNTEDRPLASFSAFAEFARVYAALGFTDLVFHQPRPDDPVWDDDPRIVEEIAANLPELHDLSAKAR